MKVDNIVLEHVGRTDLAYTIYDNITDRCKRAFSFDDIEVINDGLRNLANALEQGARTRPAAASRGTWTSERTGSGAPPSAATGVLSSRTRTSSAGAAPPRSPDATSAS